MEGRHFLEVRLFGYSNPTGKCNTCEVLTPSERECCDSFGETYCNDSLHLCDSYFVYCLGNQAGCISGTERRSEVNINDGPLNFSLNSVLGLENPIIISGATGSYTVSVANKP